MARIVVQRVRSASVTVDGEEVGAIGLGLAVLLGIREGDDEAAVDRLAEKTSVMRIFRDENGKMNRSAAEAGGSILVVSQFTLFADMRRGRRPSFIAAAPPEMANRLYERYCERLEGHGYTVARGRFAADMLVSIENDGPVTIVLDSTDL